MKKTDTYKPEESYIFDLLATISDPEIPVLSVIDLGIIRQVKVDNKNVEVVITPTYSGCPAMDMIATLIKMELSAAGYFPTITTILSPAWTTDWITEEGKKKLNAYGIAPPPHSSQKNTSVSCPQCGSENTMMISEFGSTACKALYKCEDCKECFDLFKCH